MKKQILSLVAIFALAPSWAGAAGAPRLTAGPLQSDRAVYVEMRITGTCETDRAVVMFHYVEEQAAGLVSVFSDCGTFEVAFVPGECEPYDPQEGVACDWWDESSGAYRMGHNYPTSEPGVRYIEAASYDADGFGWNLYGDVPISL